MQVAVETSASPPVIKPKMEFATLISFLAMPPEDIKVPERIKKGIANRGKEFNPVKEFCVSITIGISGKAASVTMHAAPMDIPMGTPKAISRNIKPNNTTISISPQSPF
jgi:hypothetical protein